MYRFKICGTKEDIAASLHLRYQVFCLEKGWINPKRFSNAQEVDEFDKYAVHFIAVNEEGRVIGTARLIMPSTLGLPIEKLIETKDLDVTQAVEVSRLAVLKTERNNEKAVFFGLTRLMWDYVSTKPVTLWGATVDEPLYRLLKRIGMPFILVGEPIWYVGSQSVPIIADIAKTEEALYNGYVEAIMKRKGCEYVDLSGTRGA